jgi:YcxB-like protein
MATAIEYQGQLSSDDWRDAHSFHARRSRSSLLQQLIGFLFGASIAIAFVLADGRVRLFVFVAATVVLLAGVIQRRRSAQRIQRLYDQSAAIRADFTTRWDDTGFRTTSSQFDDRRAWKDFVRWRETAHHIFVYEGSDIFRIVPKRLLGEEDLSRLRELLLTHLGAAA